MTDYFELEVSLEDIQPRIWRRMLIRSTATFSDLHDAIQDAFGWEGYHMWEFRRPGRRGEPIAGLPDDGGWDEPVPDAEEVDLAGYFGGHTGPRTCTYVYDFGDDWVHEVKLRKTHSDSATFLRRLLDGGRAAPPEDCGGVPGYYRCLEVAAARSAADDDEADGDDEAYGDDLDEWLGDWDPDDFDLEIAKRSFDR